MKRAILGALFLVFGSAAHGQMYKWTDKDGKVHYSDMPPPNEAQSQGTRPSPASPPSADAKGKSAPARAGSARDGEPGGKFRAEEERALGVMCMLAVMQFGCRLEISRYCTMDELATGGPGGKLGSFERDIRRDPDYQYSVDVRGDDVTFAAAPRRPGLAGFLNTGDAVHYNPGGRASAGDRRVRGGVNCQGFTK
jgi:hypothetical protein